MSQKIWQFSYTVHVTPEQVYGVNNPCSIVPNDYEILGFRIPEYGEMFLDVLNNPNKCVDTDWSRKAPRFILKKKNQVISKNTELKYTVGEVYGGDVKIPDNYEFVKFDYVQEDEKYLSKHDPEDICEKTEYSYIDGNSPRIIVKKIS